MRRCSRVGICGAVVVVLLVCGCAENSVSSDRRDGSGLTEPAAGALPSESGPNDANIDTTQNNQQTSTAQPDPQTSAAGQSETAATADGRSDGSSTPQDTNRQPTQDGTQEAVGEEAGWLFQRRLGPDEPGCGSPFVLPGESVGLSASGFAPFSEVDISVIAAILPDTLLEPATIPAVTADGQGIIDIVWVVPEAPPPQEDPVPRAYAATAEGTGWNGGTFTAYMIDPLVAYPGTAPCAVEDFVAAAFGEPVRVDVLANDVAPVGGSLDPATVEVLPVRGGELEADPSDGTVAFVPDPGFAATTTANYRIYDNWGIGVQGEVTISVDAGCTIYAVEGVVDVAGTDRDDVICAADLAELDTFEDNGTFHIIDAGAGDDVIFASKGTDWVYGGDGDDTIFGREGADRIFGGDGDDTIYGGSYGDELDGGEGMDLLDGGSGDDVCAGGESIMQCES